MGRQDDECESRRLGVDGSILVSMKKWKCADGTI